MAIDYQKVLLDMNRPRRRPKSGWKKLLLLAVVLALGLGGYAAWRYELPAKTVDAASSLLARVMNRSTGEEDDPTVSAAGDDQAVTTTLASATVPVGNGPEAVQTMRPPAAATAVHQGGPVDVATQSSSQPRLAVPPTALAVRPAPATPPAQAPARPVTPAAPAASPASRPAPASTPAARAAVPASTPVLSDARAQMRVVDQLLATDPAEALQRLDDLIATTRLDPEEAAEAGYRRGYAGRLLRNEELAETSWRETMTKYPTLRGGRFAALALGDTWFHRYAGERPQVSYWDDIQGMYSCVLGTDDAPFLPSEVRAAVKQRITRLNDSLFFGSAPSKMARYHRVESGELLGSIASKYRVDYESIARINGIDPNRIRVGMDLKLIVGEVSVVVRKNTANPEIGPTLTWYLDGRWVREYPACVGVGVKTPPGTYNLTSKERDPSWTNPVNGQLLPNDHPENILGSRWMAMKGMDTQGLGIHGTTVDDSIPGYTSAGCIRLLDKNVEELFSYARIGNKVTVLD